jgi:hypothetical protein
VNNPPVLAPLPTYAVSVGDLLSVTNHAFDVDIPAQKLAYELVDGPNSARLNRTNGVFSWRPDASYASSTQYFTIQVSDDGVPPAQATQVLSVIVNDYLAVGLGSVVTLTQRTTNVALTVYASAGVTNLCFILEYPPQLLGNVSLGELSPRICSARVTPQGESGRLSICLSTCPGEALVGTETLGQLQFTTLGSSSGFAALRVQEAVAGRGDGKPVDRVAAYDGRVVVIGREALLEATRGRPPVAGQGQGQGPTNGVWLTLYGQAGASYVVVRQGALTRPVAWEAMTTIGLEGLWESFPLAETSRPAQFFAAYELVAEPPVLRVDETGELVLFGLRGASYRIERTSDLTGATGWSSVATVTLINSFRVLDGLGPSDGSFLLRAIRQ